LISHALQHVNTRIAQACAQAQRPREAVTLVAVSKTFSAEAVIAAIEAGQRDFGENYVQESVEKIAQIASHYAALKVIRLPIWHFIGPVQSNKARQIAEHFDWVHSVDRLKIAERLNEYRPLHLPALNICLQVNISKEASKSGFAIAEVRQAAQKIVQLSRLRLRGLMCIPHPFTDLSMQRRSFAQLRMLLDTLRAQGVTLDTLSMGMSNDLETAILEGATIVRVGSAIFGPRSYSNCVN
jgi:pyridoxal phosphate enzyme (YggS family)